MANAVTMMFKATINGLMWLCMTPFIVAKMAFGALMIPIRWVVNSMNHWYSSEDQCLRRPISFTDHGVGTPVPDQVVDPLDASIMSV